MDFTTLSLKYLNHIRILKESPKNYSSFKKKATNIIATYMSNLCTFVYHTINLLPNTEVIKRSYGICIYICGKLFCLFYVCTLCIYFSIYAIMHFFDFITQRKISNHIPNTMQIITRLTIYIHTNTFAAALAFLLRRNDAYFIQIMCINTFILCVMCP